MQPGSKRDDALRSRVTVPLGEGIKHCLRGLGIEGKIREERAVLAFPGIVQEIIGKEMAAEVVNLRNGELTVSVRHDALRHRLLFERDRLQNCLNEAAGSNVVRSIRFGR